MRLLLAFIVASFIVPAAAVAQGDPALVARADGQEILEVRVDGVRRVEAEAVRRALPQKVGSAFDPGRSGEDLQALWQLGYFSDVALRIEEKAGGVVYVVEVEERPAVRQIRVNGNEALDKDSLAEVIEIRSGSILDLDAVRRNVQTISEKYIEKGYFLVEVDYRLEPVPPGQLVDIVFVVRENAKVTVKEIEFVGVERVPEEELRAVMATREGGLFSFLTSEGNFREEMLERDVAVIQASYYDRGFINVRVDPPLLSLSPDKRFIYILIKVEEGERYRISDIGFEGDLLVDERTLDALVTTEPGEFFNRAKLVQDIETLSDLYADRGYAYANVNPVTRVEADERAVGLTFDIQQGEQVTIERIDIKGNTKTRDKVIRRELRIYEGELFSGTGVRRSQDRVTALGFFDSVEVTHRPGSDPTKVVVDVTVDEKATGTFQLGFGFSNVENFIFTAQIAQDNFLGWGPSLSASAQISGLRNLVQVSYFDRYFLDTLFIFSTDLFRTESDYFSFSRQSTGGTVNVGYHLLEDVMANVGYTFEYVEIDLINDGIFLANQFRDGITSSIRLSATWDRRDNRLFPSSGFMHHAQVELAPPQLGGSYLFNKYSANSNLYFPLPLGMVFKTRAMVGYIQSLATDAPLPASELYYLGGIQTLRGFALRSVSPTTRVAIGGTPDAIVSEQDTGGNKQLIFNAELEVPIFAEAGIKGVLFYDAGNSFAPEEAFFQDRQNDLPLGLLHSVGFGFRWFSPVGPLRFEWGFPLTPRAQDEPYVFEFTIGNSF